MKAVQTLQKEVKSYIASGKSTFSMGERSFEQTLTVLAKEPGHRWLHALEKEPPAAALAAALPGGVFAAGASERIKVGPGVGVEPNRWENRVSAIYTQHTHHRSRCQQVPLGIGESRNAVAICTLGNSDRVCSFHDRPC